MKTTIDAAGRLVIPKAIREQAGLRPGDPLDVRYRDGHIEIEPEPLDVDLVEEGPFLVAVPRKLVAPLTADIVERTRAALLDERADGAELP